VANQHPVTGKTACLPEPSLAHRQGRVMGTNIAGGFATFPGIIGSYTVKAFDLAVAGTGLNLAGTKVEGLDAEAVLVVQQDHTHFYPVQEFIYLQLVVDRKSRRLSGAQGVCRNGDALVGRINSIAALISRGGAIEYLSNLEMAYTPPFGTALDIVNTVGLQGGVVGLKKAGLLDLDQGGPGEAVFLANDNLPGIFLVRRQPGKS
jgi:NADPH-dependent 2,4-dienoyl-CoA reductase/sulfur reductase-like enzyme